ncbi:MAG: hypothetical protein KME46_32645 [Brasilonema angustatum HA4187-MV1]|jgi:hypothetical protein|nr:hypothetical protein [Brasilonema angustatum HA4187-MV1]
MLRHLKNINELCLYAGLSCLVAFITRLNPVFFFPILMLRLSIVGYCLYIISYAEGNRTTARIISAAVLIGWIGGYWDLIEVYWRWNSEEIIKSIMLILAIPIILFALYLQWTHGKNATRR